MQAELLVKGTPPNNPAYNTALSPTSTSAGVQLALCAVHASQASAMMQLSEMSVQLCICCMFAAGLDAPPVNTSFPLHTKLICFPACKADVHGLQQVLYI